MRMTSEFSMSQTKSTNKDGVMILAPTSSKFPAQFKNAVIATYPRFGQNVQIVADKP